MISPIQHFSAHVTRDRIVTLLKIALIWGFLSISGGVVRADAKDQPKGPSQTLWIRVSLDKNLYKNNPANLQILTSDEAGISTHTAIAMRKKIRSVGEYSKLRHLKIVGIGASNEKRILGHLNPCGGNMAIISIRAEDMGSSRAKIEVEKIGCRTSQLLRREIFSLKYPREGVSGDAWGGTSLKITEIGLNVINLLGGKNGLR